MIKHILICLCFYSVFFLSTSQAEEQSKSIGGTIIDIPPVGDGKPPVVGGSSKGPDEEPIASNKLQFALKATSGAINYQYEEVTRNATFRTTSIITDKQGNSTDYVSNPTVVYLNTPSKQTDNLAFIGFGGNVRWGDWVAEVYVQQSNKGTDQVLTSGRYLDQYDIGEYSDKSFRFTDYSGTIGYELFLNLVVSVGYKNSKLESTERIAKPISEITSIDTEILSEETNRKAIIPSLYGLREFTTYGPSLGVSYSWQLNQDMSIEFGTAYGWLKGKRDEISGTGHPESTNGLSFNIGFRGRISGSHLGYSISLHNFSYKTESIFEAVHTIHTDNENSSTDTIINSSTQYDIKQSLNTLKFTLVYEF